MSRKHKAHGSLGDRAAGNGILNRRVFLENTLIAGAVGAVGGSSGAQAQPLVDARWMKEPGAGFIPYGQPSRFESKVVRVIPAPANPATPGIGTARTPHHLLDGMITPTGLHFERSHSGIPDIDPDQHRLVIHGLVKRPLVFTLESAVALSDGIAHRLHRMRRQQRRRSTRRRRNRSTCRPSTACSACSEWTGVRLSTLLDEAGVDPRREMGGRRRRRCRLDEPQLPARQGDG